MTVLLCSGPPSASCEELTNILVLSGLEDFGASAEGARFRDILDNASDAASRARLAAHLEDLVSAAASSEGHTLFHHSGLFETFGEAPISGALYLLFYCSPAQALGDLKYGDLLSEANIEQTLADWRLRLLRMLELYKAHPKQYMLLNVNDVRRAPAEFITKVAEFTGANLNTEIPPPSEANYQDQLFGYLSRQLTAKQFEALELYADAKLQGTLLGSLESLNELEGAGAGTEQQALELWRGLKNGIEELKSTAAEASRARTQLEDELKSASAEASNARKQLEGELAERAAAASKLARTVEINDLQIKQLQEEVDHYYQQLQVKETEINSLQNEVRLAGFHGPLDGVCQACTLENMRDFGSETHVDLQLGQLQLADARIRESLRCKLIAGNERCGLEFRPQSDGDGILPWANLEADEYEPFLPLIFGGDSSLTERSRRLLQTLSSNERRIVVGTVCALTRHLNYQTLRDSKPPLTDQQLQQILRTAQALELWLQQQNSWISFDQCSLPATPENGGKGLLRVRLETVLTGGDQLDLVEFKLVLEKAIDTFPYADACLLEFRELEGYPPLFRAWPPCTRDEHGPYMLVSCTDLSNLPVLHVPEGLGVSDVNRLHALMMQLPRIVELVADRTPNQASNWERWQFITEALASIAQDTAFQVTEKKALLKFKEQFRHGDYAHVAFEIPRDNGKLIVKLQARNLDTNAKAATPAIEFRTSNGAALPFFNTRLAQEDVHGPFVVLAGNILKRRITKKPTWETHAEDFALIEEVLRLMLVQLDRIDLGSHENTLPREFWKRLCNDLSVTLFG